MVKNYNADDAVKSAIENSVISNKLKELSFSISIAAIIVGIIVIIGWIIDIPIFKSILPGFASMKMNTAILFVFTGIALSAYHLGFKYNTSKKYFFRSSLIASILVIIISLLILSEHITGRDLHIDQLFINDHITYSTLLPPGRMAFITALNFLLLGISILLLQYKKKPTVWFSQATSIAVAIFSALGFICYIYDAHSMYIFFPFSAIALHTAILFLIISAGVLSARPELLLMKTFTGSSLGSIMIRKLFPYAIGIPVCLGLITIEGLKWNIYNEDFGLSIMVLFSIVLLLIVIIKNADSINLMEFRQIMVKAEMHSMEEDADLYNNAPCGYHSLNSEGMVIQINSTELKWLGYTKEEVIGKLQIHKILSEKGNSIFKKTFPEFKKRGYLNSLELEMQRKDGSVFPILLNATAIMDEKGNFIKSRSTIFDLTEQKRFQQSILEANERFSRIFVASPLAMTICSLSDFRFTDVNNRFLELFNFKRDEVIGKSAEELKLFVKTDDLQKLQSLNYNESVLRYFEIKMNTNAGGTLTTNVSSAVVEIDRVLYLVIMILDITKRKESEEQLNRYRLHLEQLVDERSAKLNEQSKQYRMLFEENPLPMMIYDLDTLAFIAVNDAAVKHFQYTREEFLNMTIKELLLPEEAPFVVDNIKNKPDKIVVRTLKNRKKAGTIITVESHSHLTKFDGKNARLAIINDITEKKQIEDTIRDAEKRFRNTLDSMLEGCQIIDNNYRYIYINKVAAAQGHSTPEKLIGITMKEAFPGIENTNVFSVITESLEKRIPYQFENEFFYPDGTSAIFKLRIEPIPEGLFILSEDITKEKHLAEEIQSYREHLEELVEERTAQLEDVNRELESFSYSVSHDLRAPLRHISGFIQILKKDIEQALNETDKKYLDYIVGAAEKMGLLIDDLLSFSRMGRIELKKKKVNMNNILKDVLNELSDETQNREIKWDIGDLPPVSGDASLLTQVMLNLVSNAVKFTRKKEVAEIEIKAELKDGEHLFIIKDNGAGFDMKYSDKLFGVFQRLHSYNEFEGTGIGLANIKRIITKHGGRVWAEGETGRGAVFYFTIPEEKETNNNE